MKKKWYQQKTFWTGLTMAVVPILSTFTSLTAEQVMAIEASLMGLMGIFLRQGVENSK